MIKVKQWVRKGEHPRSGEKDKIKRLERKIKKEGRTPRQIEKEVVELKEKRKVYLSVQWLLHPPVGVHQTQVHQHATLAKVPGGDKVQVQP